MKTSQEAGDHLVQFKFSWTKVKKLPKHDFIAADALLKSFEEGVTNYVNKMWGRLLRDLDGIRTHENFIRILGLEALMRIKAPPIPTVAQPHAASGTVVE